MGNVHQIGLKRKEMKPPPGIYIYIPLYTQEKFMREKLDFLVCGSKKKVTSKTHLLGGYFVPKKTSHTPPVTRWAPSYNPYINVLIINGFAWGSYFAPYKWNHNLNSLQLVVWAHLVSTHM